MKAKPEIVEAFYSGFINQPRSKLKLPVNELIKPKFEFKSNLLNTPTGSALEIKSNADLMLERLRSSKDSDLIPRLETINEITKEFAIEGNWEKAESLILNIRNDCSKHIKCFFIEVLLFLCSRSGTLL